MRCTRAFLAGLLTSLLAIGLAGTAAAQTVAELKDTLRINEQQVLAIRGDVTKLPEAQTQLLERQRQYLNSEYRDSLIAYAEAELAAGTPDEQTREYLVKRVNTELTELEADYRKINKLFNDHLPAAMSRDQAEYLPAVKDLNDYATSADIYVRQFGSLLSITQQIETDQPYDKRDFIDFIELRARLAASWLLAVKNRLDRLTALPVDQIDPVTQDDIDTHQQSRALAISSLRRSANILEAEGRNVDFYRYALLQTASGLTTDIFAGGVLATIFTRLWESFLEWLGTQGPALLMQILITVAIIYLFGKLANAARKVVRRGMQQSVVRPSRLLSEFAIIWSGRAVMAVGLLIAIAQFGIEIGPLLAGLGIAGFIVGFALQDTLSNFASGVMILIYRPFDVGDLVETAGVSGTVSDMNLVSTRILTLDNQMLVVPNTKIWGDVIRNVTDQRIRRVDMVFGIGYDDDIAKAEKVLKEIILAHPGTLEDPEPNIRVHELGDSSVNFIARPWAKTDDYWDVYWDVTREVKRRFDEEDIGIPFPQRDVHVYHHDDDDKESKKAFAKAPVSKTHEMPVDADGGGDGDGDGEA